MREDFDKVKLIFLTIRRACLMIAAAIAKVYMEKPGED